MTPARRTGSATGRSDRNRYALLAALIVGVGPIVAAPAVVAADADRGRDLAGRWCNACHSIGVDEPRQEDAGPQFAELANRDAAYLLAAIDRPHDFMPDFPRLSAADKADLVAYIRTVD